MKLRSKVAKGAILVAAAGAVTVAAVAPAMAVEAETAESTAYVADGTILGQSIIRLFETAADDQTPTDDNGGSITLGPLAFSAVNSHSAVDLSNSTASAQAEVAGLDLNLGNFGGFSAVARITAVEATCQINEDGTHSATSNQPIVELVITIPFVGSQTIAVPFIDGVATLGFQGLNLGTVELGQSDNDISDGVISATGAKVTLLNVGPVQAGSITLARAECGPIVPVADVPAVDPMVAGSVGAAGLLGLVAFQLATAARRRSDQQV